MRNLLKWFLPVLTGVLVLLAWAGIKHGFEIRSFILPGPGEVWAAAVREHATLGHAALTTFTGAVLGFVVAAVVGFALALLLATSPLTRRSLYPLILILQMVPVVVLAPVFVIWLGPGLPSVTLITFIICFFPIVANTTQGLISTEQNMVDLFRMCSATKVQEIILLRVPYALPYFLTGLRIAGSLAMIGAIAGEFFAGNSAGGTGGLGFMVIVYNAQLKIPALFATGFAACLCGFIFVSLVLWLNWLLLHTWHDSIQRADQ